MVIAAPGGRDRFFVLTQADIRMVVIAEYSKWMDRHGWKRPRKSESFHCTYTIAGIARFEDNWDLITERLHPIAPDAPPTEAAEEV